MINKQNLWFITLFSLIMVLSIYYLTMSDDTLSTIKAEQKENNASEVVTTISDTLVALKVADEEALVSKISKLENTLLDSTATLEEKNKAYEELQNINKNEANKETIQAMLKEKFKLDSFVSIDNSNIKVTIASKKHDPLLANNIIRSIQELYDKEMYISVKFDN